MDDHTLDVDTSGLKRDRALPPESYLIVALECDRPLALSVRHRLGRAGTVHVGRGAARGAVRAGDHRASKLSVTVPDRRMSSEHARLEGVLGSWTIRDAGSRNGVIVNGERVEEATLGHGDVIQLGHTFFVYWTAPASAVEGEHDLDVSESSGGADDRARLETLDPRLAAAYGKLAQLARAEVSILVMGETGTGKEVTARALHQLAGVGGRFVGVNCGAIPQTLLEGELFGSVKGAYSGSIGDRPGLVREADRGTLFLDEIGDLPLASQAAFLRVLEERKVRPVGGTQAHPIELRLVSATNQDLERLVREGRFRNDLFARIAGFRITLPPLRERASDLGLLVGRLLSRITGDASKVVLSPEAGWALFDYDWPLNVRELGNWLTAATALAEGGTILPEHFPETVQLGGKPAGAEDAEDAEGSGGRPLNESQAAHRTEVLSLLRKHAGNVSAVARETGKARNQIQRWIRRYGIDPEEFR